MNKTFVTKMPNHIGAFLKASRCFASLGINITRVSYNKAVDSHMLFIDAEGTPEQLSKATEELTAIGYLQCDEEDRSVVLLEFKLKIGDLRCLVLVLTCIGSRQDRIVLIL